MQRQPELSSVEERWRRVLDALMRLSDRPDRAIAQAVGASTQAIQQRRTGGSRIRPHHVEELATAFNVPIDLFDLEPIEAIKWVLDHRPELLQDTSRCMSALIAV